ncbi:MAG: CBS domain-containing protein, partial [Halobacteria archaeon]|nr:CBS domain-containing protein [Halobacteria archaeon]
IPVSRVTFPTEPVKELMIEDVITVVRSTDVSDAAKHMSDNGVHHLPLTRGDSLIGMVTDFDILKALVR